MPASPPQPVVQPFSALLRALLRRHNVRASEAARHLGVTAATFEVILRDELPPARVSSDRLRALLAALPASTSAEREALLTAHEAPRAPRPSHRYRPAERSS